MATRDFGLLVVALLLFALPARAANQEARAAYREGIRHYNLGEYAPALEAFKNAYRLVEEPSLLFNIGQCERALDLRREAIRSYRAYLREERRVEPATRSNVEKLIADLELALRQEEVARSHPPHGAIDHPTPKSSTAPDAAKPSAAPPPADVPQAIVAKPVAAPAARRPVHKQWWFWTIAGVVVAGAVVGGTVGGLAARPTEHVFAGVSF
jgi:hypothetical protein